MSDRLYTLHITFPAFTDDEAVDVMNGLELLLGDHVGLRLTTADDWSGGAE